MVTILSPSRRNSSTRHENVSKVLTARRFVPSFILPRDGGHPMALRETTESRDEKCSVEDAGVALDVD